jgi:hypothetical protein
MAVEPAVRAFMPTPKIISSDDLNAALERVIPDVLVLLADGVPRSRPVIVTALADRHPRDEVRRAIARLAVLGRIDDRGGSKYTLAAPEPVAG